MDFSKEYFEFKQSNKKRAKSMTRCRLPQFSLKKDRKISGYWMLKAAEYYSDLLINEINVYTFKKIILVLFRRKLGKICYLMG